MAIFMAISLAWTADKPMPKAMGRLSTSVQSPQNGARLMVPSLAMNSGQGKQDHGCVTLGRWPDGPTRQTTNIGKLRECAGPGWCGVHQTPIF
jgi:hypothetical protein